MAVLRNVICCLEREQLPIFKDTIELALKTYYEEQPNHNLRPSMLLQREAITVGDDTLTVSQLVCSKAKDLIEKEISANIKEFDL